jgi:ketosteroid isomerase-like protein
MLTPRGFTTLTVLFLLTGCADSPGQVGSYAGAPADAAAPDPTQLMQADRDFAAAVADGGSAAWASWFAEDGAMIQPGVGEITGRDAILARMAGLDDPEVHLRWEPLRADIADSGDLGWTTGTYVSESPGEDGEVVRGEGRYVTIWRRAEDGSWKVVMDLGNPATAP